MGGEEHKVTVRSNRQEATCSERFWNEVTENTDSGVRPTWIRAMDGKSQLSDVGQVTHLRKFQLPHG